MKSRLLCMCTCLALAVSGLTAARAENPDFQTLSQLRESCQSGWHETVQAFGREITIDLDAAVPDVECFPVMEADPIPLAEGRSSEASVITGDVEQWMSTGFLRIDVPNRLVKSAAQKAHPASAAPGGYNQYPILRQFGEFDTNTAYAFNNPTTVADAQQLLLDAWEGLYPGENIALLPHRLIAYQGDMKYDYRTDTYSGDPLPESEATLMVYFDQTVGGIPVICGAAESFTRYAGMNNREAYRYHGAIAITQGLKSIGLNEIYKSLQFHLLGPAALLAEDVPLCSFEEVKETYLDLIRAGRLRSIANLRLGYAVWLNETGSAFTLLPTWVAEGELYPDAETPDASVQKQYDAVSSYWGPILVNAQTAELIDPYNAASSRSFDKPGLLLWEDV